LKRIYLDHNATTPVAPEALEAMMPWQREHFGNPSSVHQEGRRARVRLDEARESVAALISAHPQEVVFTSGGTESNNFALLGVALMLGQSRRRIITTAIEHPSVLNPLRQLAPLGFDIGYLSPEADGRIDPDRLAAALDGQPAALVSIQRANSEVGTLQEIATLCEMAHRAGALFHADAVQTAGKLGLDMSALPVDLLSLSSHKLCGPKGVGALFIRRGTPALFSPVAGGSQERKRRGGTENVAGIIGFGVAARLARSRLAAGVPEEVRQLRDGFYQMIREAVPDVRRFGSAEFSLPNTLGLGFPGREGQGLLIGLDMEGIAVSTGSACSSGSGQQSHVLAAMGVGETDIESSLRFSLGWQHTREELQGVAAVLGRLAGKPRNPVAPSVS
jgi:cysteine desulfurase